MSPLPLPVRIAAGLVATAVEQARDLPRLVVELPVTAVSQALQASMRVQQKVTELAIKGDRALGTLRPVEERPSWAVFDDEEPAERNGGSNVSELHQRARDAVVTIAAEPAPAPAEPEKVVEKAAEVAAETTAAKAAHATPTTSGTGAGSAGPNVLPGYRDLTIPQLRGRLRHLDVDDLRTLLEWETNHDNRPPFVTMLSNRITTVTEG
ncbi:lipid droplet-associated protein [Pseudonocardia xinjiangensis]|uniref:Lipid droplet-associated protein n=1 Tax=Pseudonocardia xinjiangensis TaxID=75289 RepID=A0ABX1RQZ3_9PSEU|nr:lipid droplet-associated protein [Pseudonocardia xinjiangensis]NMH82402.1 lipid droplet-associated protein [Pseudonocardia xinjiangensis]